MFKTFIAFVLLSNSPLNKAMESCESPSSLRAAFTVELSSDGVTQICQFDPRPESYKDFTCSLPAAPSALLADKIAQWEAAPDPDNWLFANGVKDYFVAKHTVDDLGAAWRIRFSPNTWDTTGTTQVSKGEAWLLPTESRFLKISYLMHPKQDANLTIERHLMFDEVEGTRYSYVHTFEEHIESTLPFPVSKSWTAKVLHVQFFYADMQNYKAKDQS